MLKKTLVAAAASLCVAGMAYAQAPITKNTNTKDVPQTVEGSSPSNAYWQQVISPMTLYVQTFTMNQQIDDLKNVKLGYSLKLKYDVNNNVYVSASVDRYNSSHYGYNALIGLDYHLKAFTPYVEAYYSNGYLWPSMTHQDSINYDVGMQYHFVMFENHPSYIYASFVNFLKNDNYMEFGGNYMITERFGIGGYYMYNKNTHDNGALLNVSYKL